MNFRLFACLWLFTSMTGFAQNVGIGTATPASTAILDVNSTTKGFLPPRLSDAQRDAIANPATGLVIFNTTSNSLEMYKGTQWVSLIPASNAVSLPNIVIGTQRWMRQNLDVAFYRNGDPIPHITDPVQWANATTGAWCYYNNDSLMGGAYGKLYNWYAVNDPRGLAPEGWHVPTDEEWTVLENLLGGEFVAGTKLKEAGTKHWATNNRGNNISGFTALPGGLRFANGAASGFETFVAYWWTATEVEDDDTSAWERHLGALNFEVRRDYTGKKTGC